MIWNSKNTTYYSKGRKAYGLGDELPADVIAQMGAETLADYIEKGWIVDETAVPVATVEPEVEVKVEAEVKEVKSERDVLFEKAKELGLNPHYKIGIPKLKAMIEDHEALQVLKAEALELDIVVRDDVTAEELTILVADEKEMRTTNESLEALKKEALGLGIDPSDDVTAEDLGLLISTKKADLGLTDPSDDELDS